MASADLTAETVELLQVLIRNRCVNDGTAASGFETRNADTLRAYLGDTGFDAQHFEPTPGAGRSWRASRAPTRTRRACA